LHYYAKSSRGLFENVTGCAPIPILGTSRPDVFTAFLSLTLNEFYSNYPLSSPPENSQPVDLRRGATMAAKKKAKKSAKKKKK